MKNKYSIVNKLISEQFDQLHALFQEMWWSKGRTKSDIECLIKNCLIIAIIDNETNELSGFARVLTDEFRYAYIFDVMTQEKLRGMGIGKMIMTHIFTHPRLKDVKHIELTCLPEMANYYKKFGFSKDYKNVIPMKLQRGI